jgi:hypothetical protein
VSHTWSHTRNANSKNGAKTKMLQLRHLRAGNIKRNIFYQLDLPGPI